MKRKLIESININAANLEYIAKTGKINGILLIEIERIMDEYKELNLSDVSESLPDFTGNDVDGAYFLGVFNSSGIDGLSDELKRIKELGLKPHQFLHLLKTKSNVR